MLDLAWRAAFRLGFPLARLWWRLWRPRHEGALVAVHVGAALLLVRASYRAEWTFPGGGVRPGEAPVAAARRELAEEVGLGTAEAALRPAGIVCGPWDGRRDQVHVFTLRLDQLPPLRLDNREIVAARLVSPAELPGLALTGPVAAYLGRMPAPWLRQAAVTDQAGHIRRLRGRRAPAPVVRWSAPACSTLPRRCGVRSRDAPIRDVWLRATLSGARPHPTACTLCVSATAVRCRSIVRRQAARDGDHGPLSRHGPRWPGRPACCPGPRCWLRYGSPPGSTQLGDPADQGRTTGVGRLRSVRS
jgi:8-oxo-dGTP diphosphatase